MKKSLIAKYQNTTNNANFHPGWMAGLVFILLLSITCGVTYKEYVYQQNFSKAKVKEKLITAIEKMENLISSNLIVLKELRAAIYNKPNLTQDEFNKLAEPLILSKLQIRHLAWAPDLVIKYVYPYQPNRSAIGLDYRLNQQQYPAVKQAMNSNRINLAGPINLVQGGTALIFRVPVIHPNTHQPIGLLLS